MAHGLAIEDFDEAVGVALASSQRRRIVAQCFGIGLARFFQPVRDDAGG